MIRVATESDIPRLLEMAQRFHRESEYREHLGANAEKMEQLGRQLIANNGVLIAEQDGKIVGMIGYYIYPHFISGEIIAGEVFWWVEPEHRGEGKALLAEAESRARSAGATKMQMIAPNDRVGELYRRLGYNFVESTYQRSLA